MKKKMTKQRAKGILKDIENCFDDLVSILKEEEGGMYSKLKEYLTRQALGIDQGFQEMLHAAGNRKDEAPDPHGPIKVTFAGLEFARRVLNEAVREVIFEQKGI